MFCQSTASSWTIQVWKQPSTPTSPNSHHHPSLYKKVPTHPIDQPQRQHEPPFPLPSRQNIPAAPTRAQIQKSSSHNQSPFGPRRHKKKRPSSANQSPSSPTRRQPPSPDHPDRSLIRRRSRSRGVCHRGIWRGRGLRSGFGVGSGGPGTPARLGVDPHLHERAHTHRTVLARQGRGGAGRGCVCSAVAGRRLSVFGDKRGELISWLCVVFGCWIRWSW